MRGIYAGSFDPPTMGHVWIIEQAINLFDEVILAVGVNPDKNAMFDLDERKAMLQETVDMVLEKVILWPEKKKVTVTSFEGDYLVRYADKVGATHLVRGVRSAEDLAFEKMMRHVNEDIEPDIESVYLIPPRQYCEVSSSLVKGLIGPNGWRDVVDRLVPPAVRAKLRERFGDE